jgi:tRNA A-37 threonylcarbamoyl transferase component Bud32
VRLHIARPTQHPDVAELPVGIRLANWELPGIHRVLGVHRHEVKLVELGEVSYVVKELPDELAEREYRLLRQLADDGLPTVEVVATVTGRVDDGPIDGLLITRHLDYSLPYRSLLSGRGLTIPFLGERLLDALVGLLVRLHLAGFFWGDCSLNNALFRRDAGTLSAYVIDVETGERHDRLTDGQRSLDLMIATDNVAGGLLDLQEAGRLTAEIDPFTVAQTIESRYANLWTELTGSEEFDPSGPADTHLRLRRRLDRLHGLGFDAEEIDVLTTDGDRSIRIVPRVVEHGFHAERLKGLTGLATGENQARRMLADIREYTADLQAERTPVPESVAAVRWLDRRFEPIIAAIPGHLLVRLEAAEIFHQLLEHRWYLAERQGHDVSLEEALPSYLDEILVTSPDERLQLDEPTAEIPRVDPIP